MVVRHNWTWLLVEKISLSIPAIRIWKVSNKRPNLSAWGPDCSGWLLVGCNSGVIRKKVMVCIGVSDPWADVVAGVMCSLFGVLEEWLLLVWRVTMDIGQGWFIIFPSDGGLTPSRSMIFMVRLQNGIHARVTDQATVFLMVWKIWAQISIRAPVIRSHRNWALPRLMKAVLDNR